MTEPTENQAALGSSAQNLLRILIASYFLAGAIGIIPAASLTPLTDRLLPPSLSQPVAATTTFVLAYLVMIGIWLRGAALLLGILTFWASYLRMFDLGLSTELGAFWRDLALIASLMLTYAEPDADSLQRRSLLRRTRPRKIRPRRVKEPSHGLPMTPNYEPFQATYGHDKLSVEEMEQIFQEDFKVARSG